MCHVLKAMAETCKIAGSEESQQRALAVEWQQAMHSFVARSCKVVDRRVERWYMYALYAKSMPVEGQNTLAAVAACLAPQHMHCWLTEQMGITMKKP